MGYWDVDTNSPWNPDPADARRVIIPLVDADQDDPREVKGMRLEGFQLNTGVGYSADLKSSMP